MPIAMQNNGPIAVEGNLLLSGYFQEFQYFHFIVEDIRSRLLVQHSKVDSIMSEIALMRETTKATTIVSIHVSKLVHPVKHCSCQGAINLSEYYTASMAHFLDKSPLFIGTSSAIFVVELLCDDDLISSVLVIEVLM